jgi:hypothetical protein
MPPIPNAEQWRRQSELLRRRVLDEVVFRGEASNWRNASTRVEWLDTISTDKGYRVRKGCATKPCPAFDSRLLYEPTQIAGGSR